MAGKQNKIDDLQTGMNYIEATKCVGKLQCNWILVRMCFKLWKNENGKNEKLMEIAGVGVNYISDICSGRKTGVQKNFNAEDYGALCGLLRGQDYILELQALKEYALVKLIKTYKIKNENDKKEWLDWINRNIGQKNEFKDFNECEAHLEQLIIEAVKNENIKELNCNGKYEDTKIGLLKKYLLRQPMEVVGDIELYLAKLLEIIVEIDCHTVEHMEDSQIENYYLYAEMLYNRIKGEIMRRDNLKLEKKLKNKIVEKK